MKWEVLLSIVKNEVKNEMKCAPTGDVDVDFWRDRDFDSNIRYKYKY